MIRRALLKGALAMIPGGLPPRRIDQLLAASEAGAPSPAAPSVTRRLIVGGAGPGAIGFFEYAGAPAFGNPPIAWAVPPGVTTDPYGNALRFGLSGGFATSDGIRAAHLTGAELDLFNVLGSPAGACSISSIDIGGSTYLQIQTAGISGGGVGSGLAYYTAPTANGNTFAAAADPAVLSSPESWHAPATPGFATIAGAQPVEYQFNSSGMVEITGAMAASGAYTGGTTIWTMPSAYRPVTNTATVGVIVDNGGVFSDNLAQITPAGAVMLVLNVAAAAEVFFTGGAYRTAL